MNRKKHSDMPEIMAPINRTALTKVSNRNSVNHVQMTAEHIQEGLMMLQLKAQTPHGLFEHVFNENFGKRYAVRTGRRYMALTLRFYKSDAAKEFMALPMETRHAQINNEGDRSIFISAIVHFLRKD
jgi:hypothetical protein